MPRVLGLLLTLVLVSSLPVAAQPPGQTNADQERAHIHYRAGWTHMRAEDFEQAAKEFQSAIDIKPKYELAHYALGRAYMALHRYDEAIRAFAACRDIFAAETSQKFNGQMEAQRHRQDRLMELQDLRSQYSKGPQTNQSQDTLRQIDNQIRLTTNVLDRGMSVTIDEPVPSFVSLSLGSAYFRAEQFDEAERQYRAAINADSKAGEAHNNLAVILMMKSRYTDAMAELKAAEKAGFRVNPDLKDQIKSRMAH
jgi:tetratricopeptide (TPR) repeat protein